MTDYYQHAHHARSYLKRTVLEDLVRTGDIKKVHIKRVLSPAQTEQRMSTMSKRHAKKTSVALSQPVSTWMWELVDKSKRSSIEDTKKDEDEKVFGAEVGVGVDWSHLNKRRRHARGGKVERDVNWVKKLDGARLESSV
jgi:hypothetical protein